MRNLSRSNQNASGFTIVELLVVIVIIGILAGITVAAYTGISERARLASAHSFASQLQRKHITQAEGLWTFEECSGASAPQNTADSQVTSALVGTMIWSTDTPSGKGCTMRFNGATRITTNASLSANYYLKAAWIKFDACANNNIISAPDTGGNNAPLYLPSCRVTAGHQSGTNVSYGRISSNETLSPGKWYHVALEFIDGTYTLYLDGKKVRDATGHPALDPTDPGVNIGAHRTGNYFTGYMDDVIVSSKRPD